MHAEFELLESLAYMVLLFEQQSLLATHKLDIDMVIQDLSSVAATTGTKGNFTFPQQLREEHLN